MAGVVQRERQRLAVYRRYRAEMSERPVLRVGMWSWSRTMMIAFGGMLSRPGIPPYEFLRLASHLRAKRVFARDLRQGWYHYGLPGHGDSIDEVAASLAAFTRRWRVKRLICTGNSAGGYAALVFGTLLGADVVLSFSPQTVLDVDELHRMNDYRWDDWIEPVVQAGKLDPAWVDLAVALPPARCADTRYWVFADNTLAADRLHAERILDLEGTRLYRFGHGGHGGLVRGLRDRHALEGLISRALDPHSAPAPVRPAVSHR